jgi:hypothetical protein
MLFFQYFCGLLIKKITLFRSVADPGCLSRILIFTHSGSRIQKLKNSNKREGWKKLVVKLFFCSHKFHEIENYFIFKCWRKKFGPVFKELKNILPQNLSLSSTKYGVGIRKKKPIPDPGSGSRGQKAPDPGSGSATLLSRIKSEFRALVSS